MQPTFPAIWSEIERYRRRRGRLTLAELSELSARAHQMHLQELRDIREMHDQLDWPRVHRSKILLYTPNQLRDLVRLGNAPETPALPTTGNVWRPGPLGAPWHLPDKDPSMETSSLSSTSGMGSDAVWSAWVYARSWGMGTMLLVMALMLVRASDRCYIRNYFRSRRSQSEEWPTANVLATNLNNPLNMDSPNDYDAYPSESSDSSSDTIYPPDLPPPYSECTTNTNNANKRVREEPPPPYSACYVAFAFPKDGTPSVRFFNGQSQNLAEDDTGTCTRYINAQTSTEELTNIAHSSNGFNHIDTGQYTGNPIGAAIHNIPYFENATDRDDDSDECTGNCVVNSLEAINIGLAPLATEELSVDTPDEVTVINIEDGYEATTCC